jgi:hypothetical protein
MFLWFLFIEIFFTSSFCSLQCTGGSQCHIQLKFNQIIPTKKELSKICSIINTSSSCFVYIKLDYDNKQANISFTEPSSEMKSIFSSTDLLTENHDASIIHRYAVHVRIQEKIKVQLYVLIECETVDHCANQQLRHFWPRFISLNSRRNSFMTFYKLLFSNETTFHSCFNDRINQTEQCSNIDNFCWASINTGRQCRQYNKNTTNGFIYSYNKVDRPHQLTTENVHYILSCHVNNCNTNESINQVRRKKK